MPETSQPSTNDSRYWGYMGASPNSGYASGVAIRIRRFVDHLCNVAPALVCTPPPPPPPPPQNNFSALNQELFEGCPGMVIVLVLVLVSHEE